MSDLKRVDAQAEAAARQGPQTRMKGQQSPLRTPGPGQFIHPSPSAKGPKEGPPQRPKGLARGSFSTEGKEGSDRG